MQVVRFNKFALSLLLSLTISIILFCTLIYIKDDFSIITFIEVQDSYNRSTTSTELLQTKLMPAKLLPSKLLPTKLLQTQESFQETNSKLDDEFLVNTLGCKMSRLPVMTSEIQKFFVPPDPVFCSLPSITESDECKK